ncbi:MAG: ribbon-helix-helix protein, CopG family [Gammaproteobacteria bacterium]
MTIRSTFALDKKTANGLARLARRWDVSKSEALRRAVARAEAQASDGVGEMSPQAALKRLAKQPPLGKEGADDWIAANRAACSASDALVARRHASRR